MSESPSEPASGHSPTSDSASDAASHSASLSGLPSRITVLSGGVGGARFLQGLLRLVERTGAATSVTVVVEQLADFLGVPAEDVHPDYEP